MKKDIKAEVEAPVATNTKILACPKVCKSDYQDKRYGKGNRVHNITGGKGLRASTPKGSRCTVCGNLLAS